MNLLLAILCKVVDSAISSSSSTTPEKLVNSFARTAERSAKNGDGNMSDSERELFISQAQCLRNESEERIVEKEHKNFND